MNVAVEKFEPKRKVLTRKELFFELFPDQPAFRWKQIEKALFQAENVSWEEITTLPKDMRNQLAKYVPWMSIYENIILESRKKDTYKGVLRTFEGEEFETVLMKNARDQWTVCVSSQVGCAMGCRFCATGTLGFKQNLSADEIVDQYRFWLYFLKKNQRISNIVFMGMGEPLANYENVKSAIDILLKNTELGSTKITVSTVGLLPFLEKIITDKDWPAVRLAISLHSADPETRTEIVPATVNDFLPKLRNWTKMYFQKYTNRRQYLTFEYIMLSGINDTEMHAKKLSAFVESVGKVKVNLIPYNFINNVHFKKSPDITIKHFVETLEKNGITVTVRKTMGDDIAAACGQLVTEKK